MATTLFVRPALPAKKIRGFLGLPGELRNRIYAYCFEDEFRVEFAADNIIFEKPRPRTVKLMIPVRDQQSGPIRKYVYKKVEVMPKTVRISRKLGKYLRVDGLRTNWETSLCPLILVCKQVYCETIAFHYQNTTVCFQAPKRMTNFIQSVPKKNLELITKLHLHYTCYNEPTGSEDRVWKNKHISGWNNACKIMAKHLTGLRHLEIWMWNDRMRDWSLRHEAVQPLLQFRRPTQGFRRSSLPSVEQGQTSSSTPTVTPKPSANLQTVNVHFATHDTLVQRWFVESQETIEGLHARFGDAIAKAILGFSEKEAMEKLMELWAEREEWQEYLGYVISDGTE